MFRIIVIGKYFQKVTSTSPHPSLQRRENPPTTPPLCKGRLGGVEIKVTGEDW
jgi:hypothetical protein